MPAMSGYEVCRRIKSNPNSQEIPIIFLSASDDAINKVEAFEVGGADYVTKPFQITEVVARLEAHLKVMRLSKELQMQMLRYQLNPHFLFNALLSVRTARPRISLLSLLIICITCSVRVIASRFT
jgi:two-component system, sensor histidine kinase and response regulator